MSPRVRVRNERRLIGPRDGKKRGVFTPQVRVWERKWPIGPRVRREKRMWWKRWIMNPRIMGLKKWRPRKRKKTRKKKKFLLLHQEG